MQTIKLTTPWGHPFLKDQLNPEILNYKFEIDNDCNECDYWVIWGDLSAGKEKLSVKCPAENVIYMTDEAHENKMFNQSFLNQFNYLLTCRDDLTHKNLIRTHEINHWHLGKTFAEVNNRTPIPKNKSLSVVCSDLTILSGHKKRYALVNKLIGHFKDRIDVFGRGFNPIDDKWDALSPYKYSIAIENSAVPGYFTEKLTECYLAHTLPIYYGPPDITNYFDPGSMLKIDINDYKSCIAAIEKLLADDPWEQLENKLTDQKLLYLNKYHLFPALCNVISKLPASSSKKRKQTIYSHDTYYPRYRLRKLYGSVKKLFSN